MADKRIVDGMYRSLKNGMWVRDEGEEGVIDQQKLWKMLIPHGPFPRALDLGGHIGCFAWWARQHLGSEVVVSVEPDPRNIEVYERNFGRGSVIQAAVTGAGGDAPVRLYNAKKYSSCHSLEPYRGRSYVEVPQVKFAALCNWHPWDMVKCDIEGGEYDLDWTLLPATVRAVCMELHYNRPAWIDKAKELDLALQHIGFRHLKAPKVNTYSKVCIAAWIRDVK